jgi:hypothetical protein
LYISYSQRPSRTQFHTVNNITTKVNLIPLEQRTRKINNETIAQFQYLLENEMWEAVFKNKVAHCKIKRLKVALL